MADDTNLTRLDFHFKELSRTIIDRKSGIKVELGHVTGLKGRFVEYQTINKGFTLCLQEQGIPQEDLDKRCQKLAEDARISHIKILITKSDFSFDNRWYILGDLQKMFDDAGQDKIRLPFELLLQNEILPVFQKFKDPEVPETETKDDH